MDKRQRQIVTMLQIESFAVFLASLYAYEYFHGSWLLFGALFFIPDLGAIGYALGSKAGSIIYNVMHMEVLPVLLGIGSIIAKMPLLGLIALTWMAHVHFDRMIGFGLKYEDGFFHTHLGTIAKKQHRRS